MSTPGLRGEISKHTGSLQADDLKQLPSEEAEAEMAEGTAQAQRIVRLAKEAENRRRGPAAVFNAIVTSASRRLYRLLENAPRPVSQALRTLLNSVRQPSGHGESFGSSSRVQSLDLFDDGAVLAAAARPREHIFWLPQSPDAINTTWSAARFCIDLLRNRVELRQRFPRALSDASSGGFASWMLTDGGDELRLSESARLKIKEAFEHPLSARTRQIFFGRPDVRTAYPLGLTPAGRRDLFRWFICFGQIEEGLRLEEIWWFFLECAEDPARELVRTYLFTPEWQRLHPAGLTVFGRNAFVDWLAESFPLSGGWIDPVTWPVKLTPAQQIRLAYSACQDWRLRFPSAFASVVSASSLLRWLAGSGSDLPDDVRDWCSCLDLQKTAAELATTGVNILGHFCYPSGLRISVEAIRDALGQARVNLSLRDLRTDASDEPYHANFDGLEVYDATIVHVQPEPLLDVAFVQADLCERAPRTYRIGYWYWELDAVPQSWLPRWPLVDEVWAATTFVTQVLKKSFGERVYTMFPGVQLGQFQRRSRSYFGLPAEEEFTFLFVFHLNSVMERKNPLGLIRAFKQAFSADEPVRLVLKTGLGDRFPDSLREIWSAGAGTKLTVIDKVLSQDETLALIDACDAYASLHRSEGLGLTLAEAMLLGKPVIATRYSGNLDFMDDKNSLLVDYQLVPVGPGIPLYESTGRWAEPSVDHAAFLMRKLYENRSRAAELGGRAKQDAENRLSLPAAGRRMVERLGQIASGNGLHFSH